YKDFHDGVGCVCEDLIVDGFDVKITHLEAFVQGADFVFAAAANNRFVIELKDDVGQLGQRQNGAVVGLHHQFDAQPFAFVFIAKHFSQCPLMIKQQPVFVSIGNQLQAIA